jgi:hypothetical protein
MSLSRTDATKNLAITCTTLKGQKGGKHEIYIYCWKKKGLTEMRKCEREKEGICEEEGNRVVS